LSTSRSRCGVLPREPEGRARARSAQRTLRLAVGLGPVGWIVVAGRG
jgi:hypothetical protein